MTPPLPTGPDESVTPIKDPTRATPHEDVDRDPDGVPHSVVGATAGFAVILAVLVAAMFIAGHGVMRYAGIVIVVFAIPFIVNALRKKADRDRDHVHPSR